MVCPARALFTLLVGYEFQDYVSSVKLKGREKEKVRCYSTVVACSGICVRIHTLQEIECFPVQDNRICKKRSSMGDALSAHVCSP